MEKTPGFTEVKFTAVCMAIYESELLIPDEIASDKEKTLNYIRDHLCEAPVLELNYWRDLDDPYDAVELDDIHDDNGEEE